MSLKPDEDFSHFQKDVDEVMLEGTRAASAAVGELIKGIANRQKLTNLKIEIDKGTTHKDLHQNLWQKYSRGVKAQAPAQTTLAIAQNALRDGHSQKATIKILSADPEYQRLAREKSTDKAHQYAELAVNAAHRKNLVAQSSQDRQKQAQRQSSKGVELE